MRSILSRFRDLLQALTANDEWIRSSRSKIHSSLPARYSNGTNTRVRKKSVRTQLNVGKRKQTRVHDISVSIKCLIGIYISSFDPTRSRYRSSARFLVQAPRSSFHQAHFGLNVNLNVKLVTGWQERCGVRERERIRRGEFIRFSFGRLIHQKKNETCFHKNGKPFLTMKRASLFFRYTSMISQQK